MKHEPNALKEAWDWSGIYVHDQAIHRFTRKLSDVFAIFAAVTAVVYYYHSELSSLSFLSAGTLATVSAGYLGKKISKPLYQFWALL
ncbi:MAG: hypothetical protein KJ875_15535 [Alphaproteobacteria bacterium]|nr:hypothetical protein [Alphaproteobacteria bacterium]MBU2162318.1 hypothetical protein [Alphaproteobacteria bacterium]MBU2243620.1 hypothetical protein [Alphaproteobacteria bacterium]